MDPIGLAGGANLYGFAAGDPVNFSDPFGLCPEAGWLRRALGLAGAACRTRDEAAIRALDAAPTGGDIEHCGEIVSSDGGYRYTTARPGGATRCGVRVGRPDYEGAYHTHPDPTPTTRPEEFSGDPGEDGDKRLGDQYGKPVYLKTPSGAIKRYDPDPAKKRGGQVTTIRKGGST